MKELKDDPFYGIISRYDRCVIEYFLMEDDAPYRDKQSHREAVLFAMLRAAERSVEEDHVAEVMRGKEAAGEPEPWRYEMEKAEATLTDAASFLYLPEILRKGKNRRVEYDCGWKNDGSGGRIPYWYAFLEPPHGTGYGPEDFRKINAALFPQGTDALEVYEWTTDWSEYFDDGHEWWGAACWSVYDRHLNRYAVLFASATD